MMDRIHHLALNLFLWLAILFLAGCLVPAAVVLWWLLDATPPLTAPGGRFAGWADARRGVALVEWTAVRNRSCPGRAYRWLVGDRVWELPPETVPYAGSTETFQGRTSKWAVTVRLPPDAAASPGTLSYRVSFEWECNPLQRWRPLVLTVPDIPIPVPPPPGP